VASVVMAAVEWVGLPGPRLPPTADTLKTPELQESHFFLSVPKVELCKLMVSELSGSQPSLHTGIILGTF
jgi:hypothetical protein